MALYNLYFSPTGGTKKVMGLLAEALGGAKQGNLANPGEVSVVFGKDDVVLLGVPSYGGRVPALAVEGPLQDKSIFPLTDEKITITKRVVLTAIWKKAE